MRNTNPNNPHNSFTIACMGKYQRGSIRKVGSSWEWRYRIRGVMHQESFSLSQITDEGTLWKHLEPAIVS
jgi:hypothetical protein